eukprot:gene8027-9431_t
MKYQYSERTFLITKIKSFFSESRERQRSSMSKSGQQHRYYNSHPKRAASPMLARGGIDNHVATEHQQQQHSQLKKSTSNYELVNDARGSNRKFRKSKIVPPQQIENMLAEQQQQTQLASTSISLHNSRVESIDDWFREPENWEINLKYLCKWKWRDEMMAHFKRYRKNRTKLMTEQFVRSDDSDQSSSSSSYSPTFSDNSSTSLRDSGVSTNDDLESLDSFVSCLEDTMSTNINGEEQLPHDPIELDHLLYNLEMLLLEELQLGMFASNMIPDTEGLGLEDLDEEMLYSLYTNQFALERSPSMSGLSPPDFSLVEHSIDDILIGISDSMSEAELEEDKIFENMLMEVKNLHLPSFSNPAQQRWSVQGACE